MREAHLSPPCANERNHVIFGLSCKGPNDAPTLLSLSLFLLFSLPVKIPPAISLRGIARCEKPILAGEYYSSGEFEARRVLFAVD